MLIMYTNHKEHVIHQNQKTDHIWEESQTASTYSKENLCHSDFLSDFQDDNLVVSWK